MTLEFSSKPRVRKAKNLSEQVVDFIMEEVENQVLRPGDFLPPENELAALFGVSRAVVREALAILKQQGIVESKQGGRTRISERLAPPPFRLLEAPGTENINMGYLYELRAALEGEAAGLAAKRATPEKLAKLKHSLDALEEAVQKSVPGTSENVEFHKALTEASGNPYIIRFTKWLDSRIRDQIQHSRNQTPGQGLPRSVQNEHVSIYEAVRDHKATQARAAVIKHLQNAANKQGFDIHTEYMADIEE